VLAASNQPNPTPTPEPIKITVLNKSISFPFPNLIPKSLGQSYSDSSFPAEERKNLIQFGLLFLALGAIIVIEPTITSFISSVLTKRTVTNTI
jgi:hypothetical protein